MKMKWKGLLKKMRIYDKSLQVDGTFSEQEMIRITKIISKVPQNGVIVEIGCLYGRSSSAIYYSKHPSVEFFTVDIFIGTSRWTGVNQYEKLIHNMCEFDFYPKIIHGTSNMAAQHFEDKSVDLLFIDANHEEEFVTNDITNFLPKMKTGATLCGHDWGFDSVKAAVRKFFSDSEIKLEQGTSIWEVIIK